MMHILTGNKRSLDWLRLALVYVRANLLQEFESLTRNPRCAIFFIDIANLGMANIALPSIKSDLGFDEGSLQWVLTAYSLTVCRLSLVPNRTNGH